MRLLKLVRFETPPELDSPRLGEMTRKIFLCLMPRYLGNFFHWNLATARDSVIFQVIQTGEISTAFSALVHQRQVGHG
jgi:hypothetical protein